MQENKFFRFVWRFNAIVIMASGVFTLASLIFIFGGEISRNIKRQNTSVVNVDRDAELKEELKIDNYRRVKGTSYLIFPLKSKQSYRSSSYSSKSTSSSRNLLFVDSRTNKKQWLLPDNKSLIVSDRPIPDRATKDNPTQAILYTVVSEDTNQDQRLTRSDLLTIGIGQPDGKKYQEIAGGIDTLLGYETIGSSQAMVIYQRKQVIYSQTVDWQDFDSLNVSKPSIVYQK